MKKLIALVLIVVLIVAWITYARRHAAPTETFRTADIKRGDLLATISATGTLEPEEVVDVGAQVAGQIKFFGPDPSDPKKTVDYRTQVDEGTILAQIDDALYQADLDNANAALASAQANQRRGEADVLQLQAKLAQASNDWQRMQDVGAQAVTKTDYDASKANFTSAQANLTVGQAAVEQAKSGVIQAQSQLTRARRNLEYCTIKSPVKGVIIDRRVNIGQTVVASLNAPSLFLIAKDLHRMAVWASVNEADIGAIHAGQPVTFTVDAIRGRTFIGSVGKVRYNASMTQNVVTYTVEVVADNSDGKLLPYLTANVRFELDRRQNVLMVPNSALRWVPQTQQVVADVREAQAAPKENQSSTPNTAGAIVRSDDDVDTTRPSHESGVVWIQEGDYVRPVKVRVGVTDGSNTEVDGPNLVEGKTIVIGTEAPDAAAQSPTNPFVPQFGKKK
jgi:HlyD family secretion protein